MIYVYIKKELRPFETDIRDLCLAFFTLQKITYVFEGEDANNDVGEKGKIVGDDILSSHVGASSASPDIVVRDYYSGSFDGDRLTIKSEVKRQLYNYLSKLTGKELLWGTLTGIRPVNIVTSMLERARSARPNDSDGARVARPYDVMGLSPITEINNPIYKENEEIIKYLKEEYYISDEKAFELIKIARNEIKILDRPEIKNYKDSYSVYVGVPFCKSTCLYCSFTSFNIEKFGKYVRGILKVELGKYWIQIT